MKFVSLPKYSFCSALAVFLMLAPALDILLPNSAWAYIPPSIHIVRSIVTKHPLTKGARVRSTVSALTNGAANGARFREVTYFNSETRVLRSVARDETDQELYVFEKKGKFSPVASLLFENQVRPLADSLKSAGVPVRLTEELAQMKDEPARLAAENGWLGRWNRGFAWVTGSRDRPAPQLWVDKESYLPLRLIFKPDDRVDVQFENYRYTREFPYPRAIIVADPQADPKSPEALGTIKAELVDISVNTELAELKQPATQGFTDAGNSAPSEVRDLIRKYYEIFR